MEKAMERKSKISRKTAETEIDLELNLDGNGKYEIDTPVPFLNHMLSSFAKHGNFDLFIKATGDTETDPHHLVEDTGICLGMAVAKCLADKSGINRFGFSIIPMDESRVSVSLDIGGRPYLAYCVEMLSEKIGNMPTVLIEDFFVALTTNALINLHIEKNRGTNSHHIIEAAFKAFGIALRCAVAKGTGGLVPSTKGVI
jgi:imidazoleglycerol-phosphate dehydratase